MPVTDESELRGILAADHIAVVGCSSTPGKDAHDVPRYLHRQGYDVIPVNPHADEIFGTQARDSLSAVPSPVEVVSVFRPSEEVGGIVEEALARDDAGVVWLQLGIHDDEAVARAEAAGTRVVQDRCIRTVHRRVL